MSGTRRKPGRLGPQVEGYRAWLAGRGYTPSTVRNMLKDLGQVGRVASRSRSLRQPNSTRSGSLTFLAARHAAGHRRAPGCLGQWRRC